MDTQPSSLSGLVEGMSQVLHPTDIADFRLVEVYFQVEFLLDELGQAFAYALRTPSCFCRRSGCHLRNARTDDRGAPTPCPVR